MRNIRYFGNYYKHLYYYYAYYVLLLVVQLLKYCVSIATLNSPL